MDCSNYRAPNSKPWLALKMIVENDTWYCSASSLPTKIILFNSVLSISALLQLYLSQLRLLSFSRLSSRGATTCWSGHHSLPPKRNVLENSCMVILHPDREVERNILVLDMTPLRSFLQREIDMGGCHQAVRLGLWITHSSASIYARSKFITTTFTAILGNHPSGSMSMPKHMEYHASKSGQT